MLLKIGAILSNILSGLAKLAGSLGIYFAGKRGAQLDFERAARKEAEKDAKRWKNRPRNINDTIVKLRDYTKPRK